MASIPVIVFVCMETNARSTSLTRGATIYPATQNLMLAARALGLGTVITTVHTKNEAAIREYFNIPDNVEIAAISVHLGILPGATPSNPVSDCL